LQRIVLITLKVNQAKIRKFINIGTDLKSYSVEKAIHLNKLTAYTPPPLPNQE
jgi:hypothetical protein